MNWLQHKNVKAKKFHSVLNICPLSEVDGSSAFQTRWFCCHSYHRRASCQGGEFFKQHNWKSYGQICFEFLPEAELGLPRKWFNFLVDLNSDLGLGISFLNLEMSMIRVTSGLYWWSLRHFHNKLGLQAGQFSTLTLYWATVVVQHIQIGLAEINRLPLKRHHLLGSVL